MKFVQLIEYNKNKIFLKNHAQNMAEKLVSTLSKKTNLSISLEQQSEILDSLFLLYVQVKD